VSFDEKIYGFESSHHTQRSDETQEAPVFRDLPKQNPHPAAEPNGVTEDPLNSLVLWRDTAQAQLDQLSKDFESFGQFQRLSWKVEMPRQQRVLLSVVVALLLGVILMDLVILWLLHRGGL
jgi:hypothetical protein